MHAHEEREGTNAHSSSSSNRISSAVFQDFILPSEPSNEGAELLPWLAECFLDRHGVGKTGCCHKANSRADKSIICRFPLPLGKCA